MVPLWWRAIDIAGTGHRLIPVDKHRVADLYLSTLVVRPGDKSRSRRQNAPWGYYTYRWG